MRPHLIIAFCLFIVYSFSQDIEISKGDLTEDQSFTRKSDFLNKKDGIQYLCQYGRVKRSKRKANALLLGLDDNLNIVSTKEIFCLDRDDVILKLFYVDGKYQVFFERINSSDNTSTLFVSELNADGKISSDIKKIDKVYAYSSKTFSVKRAQDSSGFIVESYNNFKKSSVSIGSIGSKVHYRLSITYLTNSFDIDKSISTQHSFIDNYYQSYLHVENEKLFYLDSGYLCIQSFSNGDLKKVEVPEFDSLVYFDVKMTHDEKRDILYIAGLFQNKSKEDKKISSNNKGLYSSHYYWMKFDCESRKFVDYKAQAYTNNVLNSFKDIKENSRIDNRLWLNQVSNIFLDHEGNVTLILRNAEADQMQNSSQPVYKSYGVLIMSLDESGAMKWFKAIDLFEYLNSISSFNEYSKWIDDKLLYVNMHYNFEKKQNEMVASFINDEGSITSSKQINMDFNEMVFLGEHNLDDDNRIIIDAYQRAGLIKSKSFFIRLNY